MNCLPRFMILWMVLLSKWVGNTACILAYLFSSASRQCREVWASQFAFLHNIKDSVLPSVACLYDCINWFLAKAHHQSSFGLSKYSTSVGGAKAKSIVGFWFSVQKQSQSLVVPPCQRSLTLVLGLRVIRLAGSQWKVH